MLIPVSYNVRSVTQRWRNTGATVLAIALAVAVIICIFALQGGIAKSLVATGTPGNVILMRSGATAELNSVVTIEDSRIMAFLPGIARNAQGRPMISPEFITTQSIVRANGGEGVNVNVRGLTPMGRELRPGIRMIEGHWYQAGMREAVISHRLSVRFGIPLNGVVQLGRSKYKIVGITDAAASAYDSEIWSDVDDLRADYSYEHYSTLMARLASDYEGPIPPIPRAIATTEDVKESKDKPVPEPYARAAEALRAAIAGDRRISHSMRTEEGYYASQTATAAPLKILGTLLALMMGPGAAIAAMNAMYAAIASRTREIGTFRVLGFRRRSLLFCFMRECMVLAALGGVVGCAASYAFMKLATSFDLANFGTMNFSSFSEIIFQFAIEPAYLVGGFAFAMCIGFFGGLLPAWTAARLPVLSALRSL